MFLYVLGEKRNFDKIYFLKGQVGNAATSHPSLWREPQVRQTHFLDNHNSHYRIIFLQLIIFLDFIDLIEVIKVSLLLSVFFVYLGTSWESSAYCSTVCPCSSIEETKECEFVLKSAFSGAVILFTCLCFLVQSIATLVNLCYFLIKQDKGFIAAVDFKFFKIPTTYLSVYKVFSNTSRTFYFISNPLGIYIG